MATTAPGKAALVLASGIHVALGGREVLADVEVAVADGEIVTLIGPNGAGKTTAVRVILGLQKADRGRVYRRPGISIGYMPQRLSLDPALPMTVGRFLALTDSGSGRRKRALDEAGVGGALDTPLSDVSGGELRRVLLARALLRDPDLLVLDEPAQGVDVGGQADLYRLIGRLRETRGCGVLLVSHDLTMVMAETDHVICLNRHVCCAGRPETVARDPSYAALFGERAAPAFAVYQHRHDHSHHADGSVVPEGRDG
ncbi:MAG: ATP-binding cassette domain-containing protein [Proteobacteria bacterium]|nr:ATP-binding cassette domain-containing protein [Pseudomonadota bacterium]